MIKAFKTTWGAGNSQDLAKAELEEARRSLLEALSAAEYAQAMVEYNTKRVERLKTFVESLPKTKP